jgi:hypothetical protein
MTGLSDPNPIPLRKPITIRPGFLADETSVLRRGRDSVVGALKSLLSLATSMAIQQKILCSEECSPDQPPMHRMQ